MVEEAPNNEIGAKYQNVQTPESGISSLVNKSDPVIYDGSIPQTMKDFPGIKLNSFDNGSNFNIHRILIFTVEKKDNNCNYYFYSLNFVCPNNS